MTPEEEKELLAGYPDLLRQPCGVGCDVCGAKPARWYKLTSTATCGRQECLNEIEQRFDGADNE
jgi:hypothetical protein